MQDTSIKSKCSVNTNLDADTFVGIKCENGDISINFPLGFEISQSDRELRKEILLLFSILAKNSDRKDSQLMGQDNIFNDNVFPIKAYLHIISDYYIRGYFKEHEVQYNASKKGKINWNRTIKIHKPYIQDMSVFYLDFITKRNTVREDELITLIHEYCVYDSFEKVGWLFTKAMPSKARIKYNYKLFASVIKIKLSETFNDRNRGLFCDMLAIINYQGAKESNRDYKYGTNRFEYIWESMIDYVFGIENKAHYFPKTAWNINGINYANASLEPDTIMILNDNVYVLDAKYYKYGDTKQARDLPESTSINKQITYGEYIAEEYEFRKRHGSEMKVYNAFLMPFNALKWKHYDDKEICWIGQATSNWKRNNKEYECVQGILIDVKYLMNINVKQNEDEIIKLADIIKKAVGKNECLDKFGERNWIVNNIISN